MKEQHHSDLTGGKPAGGKKDGRLNVLLGIGREFSVSSVLSDMPEAICKLVLGEQDLVDRVKHKPFFIRVAVVRKWAFMVVVAVIIVTLL